MTDGLKNPDLPAGAIVDWDTDEDGRKWGLRNDGKRLISARHNPWYVLMTIYGEQEGDVRLTALAEPNRKAWNAWAGQALSAEAREVLAQKARIDPAELAGWAELRAGIEERFRERLPNVALPSPEDAIDLRDTAFPKTVDLEKAVFPALAWFTGATFAADAWFTGATFAGTARFDGAAFAADARFGRATFATTAQFTAATFAADAQFTGATFGGYAGFERATFAADVWFSGATFAATLFTGATFYADAFFNDATFAATARFDGATFADAAWFASTTFAGYAKFVQTRFGADANFNDTLFERPASFRGAAFERAYPSLAGAILHEGTEFTAEREAGIEFRDLFGNWEKEKHRGFWPDNPTHLGIARDTAAKLRHHFGRQGQPEAEHFFFEREMTFKRKLPPRSEDGGWLGLVLNWTYWLFSGYGGSVGVPGVWLVNVWLAGFWPFAAHFQFALGQASGAAFANASSLSVANALAFLGFHRVWFEREFLAELPMWMKLIGGLQTVLGFVFLFFLGLGLRTRFRLR